MNYTGSKGKLAGKWPLLLSSKVHWEEHVYLSGLKSETVHSLLTIPWLTRTSLSALVLTVDGASFLIGRSYWKEPKD